MSLGPQCCENAPTLSSSCGGGHVEEIGGIKSYVSGSLDSKLCVLVSDVFGDEAPNLRKIADKVAAAGFNVVVPDFFLGDPFVPENTERPALTWLKDHAPDERFEIAKPVIEDLKAKGVSKIGAAGFCWGGKVVVVLAKHAYVQAAVILHPSFVIVENINGVKVPISILGAETDHRSPPEVLKQFEDALKTKSEVDFFVKVFPGVSHGWSLRYQDRDEPVVKCTKEAHQDMLDWFIKYLK